MTVVVELHRILTAGDFVIDRKRTYQHQCHLQTFFLTDLFHVINFSQIEHESQSVKGNEKIQLTQLFTFAN